MFEEGAVLLSKHVCVSHLADNMFRLISVLPVLNCLPIFHTMDSSRCCFYFSPIHFRIHSWLDTSILIVQYSPVSHLLFSYKLQGCIHISMVFPGITCVSSFFFFWCKTVATHDNKMPLQWR